MSRWLAPMMVAAALGPWLRAEPPALTAAEAMRRHVEALGGRERIAAIHSLKKTGRYAYNGLEHPLVSYHKPGRRCREELEGLRLWAESTWPGHKVLRGTNGRVAWIEDESRPAEYRSISPERAALMLEEADFQWALVEAEGRQVELLGRGEVEGTPTHRLRVNLAPGLSIDWHLGLDSFLVLRKEVVAERDRDLERPWAWQFDDYRPVNGVLMPFWVYVEEPLFARDYLFETIEADPEIDDSLFEPTPGAFQGPPPPSTVPLSPSGAAGNAESPSPSGGVGQFDAVAARIFPTGHPGESRGPGVRPRVPGTHAHATPWIPACAGMTETARRRTVPPSAVRAEAG